LKASVSAHSASAAAPPPTQVVPKQPPTYVAYLPTAKQLMDTAKGEQRSLKATEKTALKPICDGLGDAVEALGELCTQAATPQGVNQARASKLKGDVEAAWTGLQSYRTTLRSMQGESDADVRRQRAETSTVKQLKFVAENAGAIDAGLNWIMSFESVRKQLRDTSKAAAMVLTQRLNSEARVFETPPRFGDDPRCTGSVAVKTDALGLDLDTRAIVCHDHVLAHKLHHLLGSSVRIRDQ